MDFPPKTHHNNPLAAFSVAHTPLATLQTTPHCKNPARGTKCHWTSFSGISTCPGTTKKCQCSCWCCRRQRHDGSWRASGKCALIRKIHQNRSKTLKISQNSWFSTEMQVRSIENHSKNMFFMGFSPTFIDFLSFPPTFALFFWTSSSFDALSVSSSILAHFSHFWLTAHCSSPSTWIGTKVKPCCQLTLVG